MRERQREARMKTAPTVPNGAKQGAETHGIPGVEASIWTERMVSALVNGVEGGKWYSLMDKVCAPKTLALAWERVRANKGAAGVDGQSVERFEAKAGAYLAELAEQLREGTYRPEAVKRVEIPKGDGQTRPLGIPTEVFFSPRALMRLSETTGLARCSKMSRTDGMYTALMSVSDPGVAVPYRWEPTFIWTILIPFILTLKKAIA